MVITKLIIEGFKGFRDRFCIEFNESVNIIVGDNEAGKSTILEAINLALTGLYAGKPVKNNISQYLFNDQLVKDYLASLRTAARLPPPALFVELHLQKTPDTVFLEGDGNCLKSSLGWLRVLMRFMWMRFRTSPVTILKSFKHCSGHPLKSRWSGIRVRPLTVLSLSLIHI